MEEHENGINKRREEFLHELSSQLNNPIHKRLLDAYRGHLPLFSMETELKNVLLEVLRHED